MFERNPLIIEAVQWTGHNEAEVQELAGSLFQAVIKCGEGVQCINCEDHSEVTAELTMILQTADADNDEDADEFTQGILTGWWIIRTPSGQITCMADSTLQANYQEIVYAGSD